MAAEWLEVGRPEGRGRRGVSRLLEPYSAVSQPLSTTERAFVRLTSATDDRHRLPSLCVSLQPSRHQRCNRLHRTGAGRSGCPHGRLSYPAPMTTDPPIGSRTVADLLAAIASDEPAPGAGAAGAVALALGLACARKALRISAKHRPDDASIRPLDAGLVAASVAALEHGRRDAQCFRALIEARQLPQDGAGEITARNGAVDQAIAAVRANTKQLLAICDDALAQLESVAARADSVMAGDVTAARAMIGAARAIQVANLEDGH
jgi:formiminotetrahydrofolate cyclodeaminase